VRAALHAEWTKIRTVAGPLWLLLGMIAATVALSDGATLRATAGSLLYLILVALLSLGIAAIVRDSATGIGVVLGLLYLLPLISQVIGDPHWQRLLHQIGPISAGLTVQATTDLHSLPLSPGPVSASPPDGPPPRSWPAAC